jgi:hypothetical protein
MITRMMISLMNHCHLEMKVVNELQKRSHDSNSQDKLKIVMLVVCNKAEFSALNRQLDQLQSALDEIESRNADIHKELLEILHSNREVRRTMREEAGSEEGDDAEDGSNSILGAGQNESSSSSKDNAAAGSDSSSKELVVDEKMADLVINTNSVGQLLNSLRGDIDKL